LTLDLGVRKAADWLGLSEPATWTLGLDAVARLQRVELPRLSVSGTPKADGTAANAME
jgi:hypothetical protein